MKKVISVLMLLLFSVSMYAEDVTQFLGIPVDGSKSEMISKLKAKGFKYSSSEDALSGEFNGTNVKVSIVETKNKVSRIVVQETYTTRNEGDIIIRFNKLCRQFQNNEKYVGVYDDQTIPDTEDLSYEMTVHNKRYQAAFYQLPQFTEEDAKDKTSWLDKLRMKLVWFMIVDFWGSYQIVMYYDNEYNRANGEDL